MRIEFFLITILAKDSILDVWHGSEYANEYLLNDYWWALESIELKSVLV